MEANLWDFEPVNVLYCAGVIAAVWIAAGLMVLRHNSTARKIRRWERQ